MSCRRGHGVRQASVQAGKGGCPRNVSAFPPGTCACPLPSRLREPKERKTEQIWNVLQHAIPTCTPSHSCQPEQPWEGQVLSIPCFVRTLQDLSSYQHQQVIYLDMNKGFNPREEIINISGNKILTHAQSLHCWHYFHVLWLRCGGVEKEGEKKMRC